MTINLYAVYKNLLYFINKIQSLNKIYTNILKPT